MIRGALRPLIRGGLRGVIPGVTDEFQALIDSLFGAGEQGLLFVPKPIVLGQQALWQQSDGTVPVTANGDSVGRGEEFSGNDNDLTQPTSADRPLYQTDGTLHWLLPDGAGDYLSLPEGVAGGLFAEPSNPFTVSIAVDVDTTTTGVQALLYKGENTGDRQFSIDVFDGDYRIGVRSITTAGDPAAVTNFPASSGRRILTIRYDTSDLMRFYIDGIFVGDAAIGISDYSALPVRLFSRAGTSAVYGHPFRGMIIHGAETTDGELDSIHSYLANLAGITL